MADVECFRGLPGGGLAVASEAVLVHLHRVGPMNFNHAFPTTLAALASLHLATTVFAAPAGDGMFATVTTNHGVFVAKLDHEKVPTTVANFVSLAEGTRTWLDARTGGLSNAPYYDGLTFHRVIDGFMIQGGSPNGLGTDGPGYQFGDEFHRDLRHDSAGILSMANSGPNSNGSQFFVTVAGTPWLDLKHSVFGKVVEGLDVVMAISKVATGEKDKPVMPVVVESVRITRNGAAAVAFDPLAQGLPVLSDARPAFRRETAGDFIERPEHPPFTETFLNGSADLATWTEHRAIKDLWVPETGPINVSAHTAGKPRYFFQVPQARYQAQPVTWVGRTLTLSIRSAEPPQTLVYEFYGEPRANVSYLTPLGNAYLNGNPSLIGAYLFGAFLQTHQLIVAARDLSVLRINLNFRSANAGYFTAQDNNTPSTQFWPFYGTFTIAP
jgi:cyclophilin family peptidyl-prolyl cis-trans isomerase